MRMTLALVALLSLAACASAPLAPRESAAPVVSTAAQSGGAALDAIRAEAGQPPLRRSDRLARAAQSHAEDMARNDFFTHRGSDGSTAGRRARQAGYDWCRVGENIYKGRDSIAAAFEAWQRSSAHRRVMLSPEYTQYGLGRARDAAGSTYWVMVLGRTNC